MQEASTTSDVLAWELQRSKLDCDPPRPANAPLEPAARKHDALHLLAEVSF